MNGKQIAENIESAIKKGRRLELNVRHGLGDPITLDFDPYIYGDDIMQHPFVWGYLPYNYINYRFRLADIISARISTQAVHVDKNAHYYYYLEEEHWAVSPVWAQTCVLFSGSHTSKLT